MSWGKCFKCMQWKLLSAFLRRTLCHLQVPICFSVAHFPFQFARTHTYLTLEKSSFLFWGSLPNWPAETKKRWRRTKPIMNFDLSISWKMTVHTEMAKFCWSHLMRNLNSMPWVLTICIWLTFEGKVAIEKVNSLWPFRRDVTNFACIFYTLALSVPGCHSVCAWLCVSMSVCG